MSLQLDPERRLALVRYLLDELEPEERNRLEERLLAEKDLQEDLELAEEELADLYVRRELSPQQRLRFEDKLSGAPDWECRIAVARAMPQMEAELATTGMEGRDRRRGRSFTFRGWRFRGSLLALSALVAILAVWLTSIPGRKDKRPSAALPSASPEVPSFLLLPAFRKAGSAQPDNIVTLPATSDPDRKSVV